ncbi:hypothetical protein DFH09DRAFT_1372731 [Mycena vulgaris]|nr:hypothetical protein DFH09DRAFT_1372731 [Mycena vulgaris]
MRLPFSILFAVILALPTFTAPISNDNAGDEFALEVRAAKKVAAKKAPVKKPAPIPVKKVAAPAKKPAKKPAAKKAPVPAKKPAAKKAPVPAKKPAAKKAPAPAKKPAAKKAPVPAKKPTAKKAPVPAKKPAAKKAPVPAKKPAPIPAKKVPAQKSAPVISCPIPPRKQKTPVRRFLEYIGLVARSNPPACAGPSTASTSTPATPAQPPAPAASASASATPPAPVLVRNPPTKAVACQNNKVKGKTNAVFVADIKEAVELARTKPIQTDTTFPHVFRNTDKVKFTEPACVNAPRNTLLEHAVGRDMKTKFRNIAGRFGTDFGQFRVVITTPDANGATTFCGVITHGLIAPKFEQNLCK